MQHSSPPRTVVGASAPSVCLIPVQNYRHTQTENLLLDFKHIDLLLLLSFISDHYLSVM